MLDGLGVPAGFADVQAFVRGNGDEVNAVCGDESAKGGDVVVLGCALRLGGAAVGLPARQQVVEELRGLRGSGRWRRSGWGWLSPGASR